jgi:hypothetical protein
MNIESIRLPDCVSSFASISPHNTFIEQSFYSAHQSQKYRVVVEPQLPRVADNLDDFGERRRGNIESFPFPDIVTAMEGICDSDQLWERLKYDAHNCNCAKTFRNGHSLFVSGAECLL